jgi:hypothetical protein
VGTGVPVVAGLVPHDVLSEHARKRGEALSLPLIDVAGGRRATMLMPVIGSPSFSYLLIGNS